MSAARKNDQSAENQPWVTLGRAMAITGIKTRHSLLILVIRGELQAKAEEVGDRVFISRESIDRYLAKQQVDVAQLSVAL